MHVFIKSMDDLAWKVVFSGCTPSTEKEELEKDLPKRELDWSVEEDKQSSNKWKVLNNIFNGGKSYTIQKHFSHWVSQRSVGHTASRV